METVDRVLFVPDRGSPYDNSPMLIGYNGTISAPHMHAMCLELLEKHLQLGMRALDFDSGEEIISGSQRLHEADRLAERAKAHGIDVNIDKATSKYIDAASYGPPLHGDFGTGLERVVMLFCSLNNIRKTSLYPLDPLRNNP